MIASRASFCAGWLALALASCDPIHTIGSEDAGSDAGPDAGLVSGCTSDGGCRCGFACGYSDDLKGPTCVPETLSCATDGGVPACSDGGVCLAPVVNGATCPIGRCFVAVGATSCASDGDCSCGYSCAVNDLGAPVCAQFTTCSSGLDCKGGDCVEVYSNGSLCPGIRRCLDE